MLSWPNIPIYDAGAGIHRPKKHKRPTIDPRRSCFPLCLSWEIEQKLYERQLDAAILGISTPFA
jgi:hypothetical protein